MSGMTVVGLAANGAEGLVEEARSALGGGRVFLRTRFHPVVASLSPGCESFDPLFEGTQPLSAVPEAIAGRLLDEAARGPVTYAVPGDPLLADATVRALRQRAREIGVDITISSPGGWLSAVLTMLPEDRLGPGLQFVDALDLAACAEQEPFSGGWLPIDPLRPAIVLNLQPAPMASLVRRALRRVFPGDARVVLITDSAATKSARESDLADIASIAPDHVDAILLLLPADPLVHGRTAASLQHIVARLRAPGGCPWDREQTHLSLRQAAIEEAYEVVDAIERGDPAEICEELGDLLLQTYLHAQLAEEAGAFTVEDVFGEITAKLVRRHPHVFGDLVAESAGAVLRNWDQIKRAERAARGESEESRPFGKIPSALPALMRAQVVARRAARAGHVLPDAAELRGPLARLARPDALADAGIVADALFAITVLAGEAGIDAEQVLRDRTHVVEAEARRGVATHERTNENNRPDGHSSDRPVKGESTT